MGEIRFVGTGETRGYPYLGCKKTFSMLNPSEHEILLLINNKLLISLVVFLFSFPECEILYAYEYENANISWHFHINQQRKFHAQLS